MKSPVVFNQFYRLLPMFLFMSVLAIPLALISLLPRVAHSTVSLANTDDMKVVSHLGENYSISSVAIQGDYAYISANPELGEPPGLAVLNISNSTAPEEIAFLPLPTEVEEIVVVGDYAFARTNNEIRIVDISSPSIPFEIGQLATGKVEAVEGNHVYINQPNGILRIWDISDAATPVDVGSYTHHGKDVEVANSYLYVLNDTGVQIIDLSNLASPTQIGFFATEGRKLAIKDGYLLIAGGDCDELGPLYLGVCTSCRGYLKVMDISKPANPILVHENRNRGLIENISVEEDYALLHIYDCFINHYSYEYHEHEVIDISDPRAPRVPQLIRSSGRMYTSIKSKSLEFGKRLALYDSAVYGNTLYLADKTQGMSIWQISAETVEQVSSYRTQAVIYDVAVVDEYAYIVGEEYKLKVVNLGNESEPTPVATFSGSASKIEVTDNYAYVLQDSNLHVIDISNPMVPIEVSIYPFGGYRSLVDLVIDSDIAFIAYPRGSSSGSLHVVDISDPTNPTLITSWSDYGIFPYLRGLAVEGNYIYISWYFDGRGARMPSENGLAIFDISNKLKPILVDGGDNRLAIDPGIAIKDNYAYVGNQGKMNVVDVSEPMTPTLVASHDVSGRIEHITIKGDRAYLGIEDGEVAIFDISNPIAPEKISFYDTPGHANAVDVADGHIYVADDNWGLITLQYASHITGQVSQANGLPFPNVSLSFSTGLVTTTNSQGDYTFGEHTFGEQLNETYTITPTHSTYIFSPTIQVVSVPPEPQINFIILPAPVSTTLTAGISSTLSVTDTQGAPTHIDVPSNAITTTATIFLTPTVETNQMGNQFAGHAFELDVSPQNLSHFKVPAPVTIHYTEADTRLISDINELALWWWQDGEWQDAAQSCNPASAYEHNLEAQTITVAICQTGRFALFGPTNHLFLPFMTN